MHKGILYAHPNGGVSIMVDENRVIQLEGIPFHMAKQGQAKAVLAVSHEDGWTFTEPEEGVNFEGDALEEFEFNFASDK